MTRKDYILIAEALREQYLFLMKYHTQYQNARSVSKSYHNGRVFEAIAIHESIGDYLAKDNPRFDREHFLAVVRGEKELTSRP